MALATGTFLGSYEIKSLLGAGGMGEVYLARDTKLGRDVAIKVLPHEFAAQPERMLRLEREAKLLASLNHPNIASIYGLEDSKGTHALVMELVSGPTLAQRLHQGVAPLEDSLAAARQIAEGLEYAHECGIIHRDLKPANIKLASSGAVKILDFGLAKAIEGDGAPGDLSSSPTISRLATQAGIIVGTAAYMSPEQAKGKPVDRRTDVWAFGCVLFEMLSGNAAFSGESVTDILAAVVRGEPDWAKLPTSTPVRVRELLQRCLQKDPKKRLQAIGEARIALENFLVNPGELIEGDSVEAAAANREAVRWRRYAGAFAAIAAVGLIAAVLLAFLWRHRVPEEHQTIRTLVTPGATLTFKLISTIGESAGFALSPDGRRLVYAVSSKDGKDLLWMRTLDSPEPQPIVGTAGGGFPFWSPDGRFIGFFADGKLKKIEAGGGPATTICDAPTARGGAWGRDGVIVFSFAFNEGLQQVNANGGKPVPLTSLDTSQNEATHRWPVFLPDGRHFLFLAGDPYTSRDNPTNTIKVGSLDSKEVKSLVRTRSSAVYASGHILYLRQNELMAQPFDLKRLEVTGDAFSLGDEVAEDRRSVRALISASENGMLVYAPISGAGQGANISFVNRSGKKVSEVTCGGDCRRPAVSPDGNSVAYDLDTPAYEVWRYDRRRDLKTRVTLSSATIHSNSSPVWSPDGRWLAYTCFLGGKYGVCRRHSDGSGEEEVLLRQVDDVLAPTDWSHDSKFLAVQRVTHGTSSVWSLPLEAGREPTPFLQSQFSQLQARFSPDGKWMAYCSNESGEYKVYVVPYPGPGGKWQISPGSGCAPRWRHDGKEIYYVSADKTMMAVQIKASGSGLDVGTANPLFETRLYNAYGNYFGNYDVTPDGEQFVLVTTGEQGNGILMLLQNWYVEPRQK
jgi:Tol biopolymer transport system component